MYQWAYRPLLVMAAVCGGLAWLRPAGRRLPWVLVLSALATIAAVAVQLVPLDARTITRMSPGTDRILTHLNLGYAAASASGAPFSHPLSISPERTAIGLGFLTCAAIWTLGIGGWLTRNRLRRLASAIAALGVATALVGITQRATSPALLYGFWQPEQPGSPFGPFVNKNHFAGWTLMVLPVTLGLARGLALRTGMRAARDWRERLVLLSRPESAATMLAVFGSFVMMVALLLTLSRSGVTSAAAALAISAVMTAGVLRMWARISILILVALAVTATVWVGIDVLATRFAEIDATSFEARAGMWRDTWRMAGDVPFVGVGIRAFTVASLLYQTGLPQFHVGAAHSDWLQLIAEGGLLVGVPALCVIAALVIESARRIRHHVRTNDFGTTYWLRVGAATGLLGIALQSLVEFSLQMPGNTMMFATLWAIAIAPCSGSAGTIERPSSRSSDTARRRRVSPEQ